MTDPREQRETQRQQRAQVIAKAIRNRDETREKLLAQGRKLARRRAENVDRGRDRAEDAPTSTNPSVHSTLPPIESNKEAAARHSHSTVPTQPKGTTVPAADRLYGLRLYEQIRTTDDTGDHDVADVDESATPAGASGACTETSSEEGDRR